MIRRITISLPDDEAQKAEHFAERLSMSLSTFCAFATQQITEAYIEADHAEAEQMRDYLATCQPAGNA